MADSRTRVLRLFVGLALVLAALAEAQTLLQSIRSETRLRTRTERMACRRLEDAWTALLPMLQAGAGDGWARAADYIQESGLSREMEVFDLAGRPLASRPGPPPVGHALDGEERRAVLDGRPFCASVEASGELRVFAYAAFPTTSPDHILRLSREEPDLAEDSAERRRSMLVHQMALGLLVLAGLLALWPIRSPADPTPLAALGAYERAMESLKRHETERSDRHAAERDRLAAALREREALSRAGEITAEIVHEVRNGLGTIMGYARLVERAGGEAEGRARLIREECEGLESTVRRFVELVRDERPNLAPFDVARLLGRVAEREARPRGGRVPSVSATAGLPLLVGDESLLERAFENLVRNALEAAGRTGSVCITVALDGDTLIVAVADDGPGLPGGAEPGRFVSTRPGGLGLGLSLARKVVTLHDGTLTLLPRSPKGTDAVVALPVRGPREPPRPSGTDSRQSGESG